MDHVGPIPPTDSSFSLHFLLQYCHVKWGNVQNAPTISRWSRWGWLTATGVNLQPFGWRGWRFRDDHWPHGAEYLEITAAKPSCTTCLRSAARLNTTLPGGLEMGSLFAAQVETTKKTRHSCPTYKEWRTKVANVLMRFRLFEAIVHAPHLILPGAPCNMTWGACMTGSKRLQTLGLKAQT